MADDESDTVNHARRPCADCSHPARLPDRAGGWGARRSGRQKGPSFLVPGLDAAHGSDAWAVDAARTCHPVGAARPDLRVGVGRRHQPAGLAGDRAGHGAEAVGGPGRGAEQHLVQRSPGRWSGSGRAGRRRIRRCLRVLRQCRIVPGRSGVHWRSGKSRPSKRPG